MMGFRESHDGLNHFVLDVERPSFPPLTATITMSCGHKYTVNGFLAVHAEKGRMALCEQCYVEAGRPDLSKS